MVAEWRECGEWPAAIARALVAEQRGCGGAGAAGTVGTVRPKELQQLEASAIPMASAKETSPCTIASLSLA